MISRFGELFSGGPFDEQEASDAGSGVQVEGGLGGRHGLVQPRRVRRDAAELGHVLAPTTRERRDSRHHLDVRLCSRHRLTPMSRECGEEHGVGTRFEFADSRPV